MERPEAEAEVEAKPGRRAGEAPDPGVGSPVEGPTRPGLPRGKPSRPRLKLVLLAAGAGGQRRGRGPDGGRGASGPEARTETAQIPGAAPEAGECPGARSHCHLPGPFACCWGTRKTPRRAGASRGRPLQSPRDLWGVRLGAAALAPRSACLSQVCTCVPSSVAARWARLARRGRKLPRVAVRLGGDPRPPRTACGLSLCCVFASRTKLVS